MMFNLLHQPQSSLKAIISKIHFPSLFRPDFFLWAVSKSSETSPETMACFQLMDSLVDYDNPQSIQSINNRVKWNIFLGTTYSITIAFSKNRPTHWDFWRSLLKNPVFLCEGTVFSSPRSLRLSSLGTSCHACWPFLRRLKAWRLGDGWGCRSSSWFQKSPVFWGDKPRGNIRNNISFQDKHMLLDL